MQTCSDDLKLYFVLQECSRANLDVVCIQEVRRLNKVDPLVMLGIAFTGMGLSGSENMVLALPSRRILRLILMAL